MKIHPATATEYAWIELDTEDESQIAAIARSLADGVALGDLNRESNRAYYAEKRAEQAEYRILQITDAVARLLAAIETYHGPLDGTVRHGGQQVDGLRCDEPFSVRVAMRQLRALAPAPGAARKETE